MRGRQARLAVGLGLALLALAACGKKASPVAPEVRAPRPVADLTGGVHDTAIELAWTPPNRRVDNSRLRDVGLTRVFRVEDAGIGEPRVAMLVGDRIAGYTELASFGAADPAPVAARGGRLVFTDRQGLTYGRRYTYAVVVADTQGRLGPPATRVAVTYVPAAEAPANVAVAAGEGATTVRWDAPTRLVDGSAVTGALMYEVLRASAADAELAPITRLPITERVLIDRGLENERTYHYAVRAVRVVGDTTAYSRSSVRVAVTPRDTTPPTPPTNLVAIPSEAMVRLTWNPSPDRDVVGYVVYRALGSGAFERVGATRAPDTTYVDRGVARGAYRYAVSAQDAAAVPNESGRSNEVRATVP
jgi:hypothetical protein